MYIATFRLPNSSLHQAMGSTAHVLPIVLWRSNVIGGFQLLLFRESNVDGFLDSSGVPV